MGALSTVHNEFDATRLQTYNLYERMYWGVPDTFKLSQRGSDAAPIYIPAPKTIIEATNRFLAKDWRVVVPPDIGSPDSVTELSLLWANMMKREQMYSKFGSQKRFGLIRGDAVWHVVANGDKPEGQRVSIYEVDPAEYFPIFDEDDDEKIVGVHLVRPIEPDPKTSVARVRRQTYRKQDGVITNEIAIYEQGYWDDRPDAVHTDREGKPELHLLERVKDETPLPDEITSIPVYHIRNTRQAGDPFGSSELRGFERILAAVNQTMSDGELSLALDGLGMYATTSGPPTDEDGNEQNWRLGPGRVVELDAESNMQRITGVTSIDPYKSMKDTLLGDVYDASAIPDVARGSVEVTTAESGIALALRMGPILAKNGEKEVEMLSTYQHLCFDITTMWFPAYEGYAAEGGAVAEPIVGDPLPKNRTKTLEEIITLYKEKIAPYSWVKQQLAVELGIELPENAEEEIRQSTAAAEQLITDPFGDRMNQEAEEPAPTQLGTEAPDGA